MQTWNVTLYDKFHCDIDDYRERATIRIKASAAHPFGLVLLPGAANGCRVGKASVSWQVGDDEHRHVGHLSAEVNTDSAHTSFTVGVVGLSGVDVKIEVETP